MRGVKPGINPLLRHDATSASEWDASNRQSADLLRQVYVLWNASKHGSVEDMVARAEGRCRFDHDVAFENATVANGRVVLDHAEGSDGDILAQLRRWVDCSQRVNLYHRKPQHGLSARWWVRRLTSASAG